MPDPTFTEAPLVHLISVDPTTLSGPELENYLRDIRAMRASPQTTRAKTERAPRKSTSHIESAKSFL